MKDKDLIHTLSEDKLSPFWSLATIGELIGEKGVFVDGDWVESKDQDPSGDVRLIQLADIGEGRYKNRSQRFLTYKKAIKLGCTFLKSGDVLIARMPDPLGRACIFPGDQKKSITVVDVAIVRTLNEKISNRWLMYFINAPFFRAAVDSLQSGSTRKRISRKNLSRITLPVPPAGEQKRIVAEIEKQFSRLDEAIANLKRAKANLKGYKAAVLKAAVEGKLTEQWRKEHPDVEPAEKLLHRILADRRAKWEQAEITKLGEISTTTSLAALKKKYKNPIPPDYETLNPLPKSWYRASTDQLFWFITSGSRGWAKYYADKGPLFLRIGNLDHDSISLDLRDIQRVQPPNGTEGTRTRVEPNDILISITADVGMIGIIPEGFPEAYINQHISLARPVRVFHSSYLAWFLTSQSGQRQFKKLQRGATKAGLGLDDIRSIYVPLPPLDEQKEIVYQIEQRFRVFEEISEAVDLSLARAERLRQSILKKAFSGKLIPQDPNDEPAAVLLERIRSQKERQNVKGVGNKME